MENKLAGLKVAAIVANSCNPDARVMKQAESLARNGAEVTVFCLRAEGVPDEQTINGVHYKRFAKKWIKESYRLFLESVVRVLTNGGGNIIYSIGVMLVYFGLAVTLFTLGIASAIFRVLAAPVRFLTGKKAESVDGVEGRRASLLKKLSGFQIFQAIFAFVKYDMYSQMWYPAVVSYKPDVIHAHDFDTVPVALCAAQKIGAKVIYDAHEIEADREGRRKGRAQIAIVDWAIRKHIKNVNGLITVCPSSTEYYFKRYNLQNLPCCIVYNTPGYFEREGVNSASNIKAQLNIKDDEMLVIYTGAIGLNRGVKEIATALKPLPDVHFCIMGPQTDEITADFMAHVRDLGIENRVHIIPPVPYKDVSATIRTADVGVCFTKPTCLNHLYSTPNKLFEMLMAGLPMVVPDLPEMGRIVKEEGVGVTVEPENVEALTEAIRTVLEHPEKYRPSADRLAQIREKWSWDAQEKRLVDLYSQLMAA